LPVQDAVATVLGVCFRLLADPKNSDSVVNTAAATVRQARMQALHAWSMLLAPMPIHDHTHMLRSVRAAGLSSHQFLASTSENYQQCC
jgi:hypothetical protein